MIDIFTAKDRWNRLTDRQKEVALRIAKGMNRTEVANEFGISKRTVAIHWGNILRKLEVHSVGVPGIVFSILSGGEKL